MTKAKRYTPNPEIGQWWADKDRRCLYHGVYQRVGEIVDQRQDPKKGTQFLVEWRPAPSKRIVPNRKKTWIRLVRFTPSASGYIYLGTTPPPLNVGPHQKGITTADLERIVNCIEEILWPKEDHEKQWSPDTLDEISTLLLKNGYGPIIERGYKPIRN